MNPWIADVPDIAEAAVDAWSLEELDRDADLESFHWALERADDPGA